MQRIFKYILPILLLLTVSACDEGFDEINTNQVDPIAIDPIFILNNAVIGTSFAGGVLVYDIGIVQQIISPNSGVLTGANYNQDNRNSTESMWIDYYRDVIKHTRDVIAQVQDKPDRANLLNMARIIQAYAFMTLTDTYGDVPYVDGGKGYTDQIILPKYDAQETIYNGVIQELTEASAALNAGGKVETGDILYAGDVGKWKRLGYSLLLRAGMRLSKANATKAQQVVGAAFQGGVMQSNADNFVIRHDNNYNNGIGNTLNATEANNYYLVKPFVDFLKNSSDPRLSAIAVRYVGAKSGPEQTAARASTDAAVQIGMPMGHDNNSIVPVAANLGLASFYDFTQADRTRVVKRDAPMFICTHAQTRLLLAEARQRGWITAGAAADYYKDGVTAHMQQMALYDARSAISTEAIDSYFKIASNNYDAAQGLKQINDQYWVASFLNGPEAFANFRRSGYPALAPNPYPNKDISGDFIRRLTYPSSELAVNTTNVNEAIGRMGPDNLETRVWWDK